MKHGNLGQMDESPFSDKLVSRTYHIPKQLLGYDSRDGGKIADQANVGGNTSNIRIGTKTYESRLKASFNDVLLNSVCLNEAVQNSFVARRKVQDLLRARQFSSSAALTNLTRREEVEIKQRELAQLAKLKGVYDKEVLDKQIILVRSRLFREFAVELICNKPGSQTPGIDKEIFDKEDIESSFEELVEFLRSIIYHPNRYRASAVKRVWIPKPGKAEKRPLGIPTVKDRALQALVNLVLLPLVELTSDPNSYGFRPYRDCKMAVAAVRNQLKTVDIHKAKGALNARYRTANKNGNFLIPNQEK